MSDPSLELEAKPYFVHSGGLFFAPEADWEPDPNCILYTGEFFELKARFGGISQDDVDRYRWVTNFITIEPGLIRRGGRHTGFQTHDDYIGWCRASQIIDQWFARSVVEYGRKTGWRFYSHKPAGLNDWWNGFFYRLPGVVQHMKICAGEPLGLVDQILWSLGMIVTTLSGRTETSGRRLRRLMRNAYLSMKYSHRYWVCNAAVSIFNRDIRSKYKNLYGDVQQIFFQRDPELKQSPTHLFARWYQGIL